MDLADVPAPSENGAEPAGRDAEEALRPRRVVDHALRRRSVLAELQRGERSIGEVCDADVYLLRAAKFHGDSTSLSCPVCRKEGLAEVSWVFGEDLGNASGSARSQTELRNLALTHDEFTVHVVEVCRSCSWNFLTESFDVGLPEGRGRAMRKRLRAARSRR